MHLFIKPMCSQLWLGDKRIINKLLSVNVVASSLDQINQDADGFIKR